MEKYYFRIGGMFCHSCEANVCRIAKKAGAARALSDYSTGELQLECNGEFNEKKFAAALEKEGYKLLARDSSLGDLAKMVLPLLVMAVVIFLAFTPEVTAFIPELNFDSTVSCSILFAAGLATSLHCLGMCGGINLAQSIQTAAQKQRLLRGNLLYNLGRIISYTGIGAIVGLIGSAFTPSMQTRSIILLIAGLGMLFIGLRMTGWIPVLRKIRFPSLPLPKSDRSPENRSLAVGLLNGFMPCGPLQAMQFYALSTGSATQGALSMFLFALGTVPAMLLIGLLGGRLNRRHASTVIQIAAMMIVIMSFGLIRSSMNILGVDILPGRQVAEVNVAQSNGDVQTVHSELDSASFPSITVRAGTPVRWNLHADRSKLNGCNNEIAIPDFRLAKRLRPGDNIIEFTPTEAGRYLYTCWMGMLYGVINVTDANGELPQDDNFVVPQNRGCSCCSFG